MKIIRTDGTFNVKGTWYSRRVYQRAKNGTMFVIHRGRRFTVNYSPYGDTFSWAPWCDDAKALAPYFN